MRSCVVFIAVLFLTVNLALHVGATDTDTDEDVAYDDDNTSQEDQDENHLLNQAHSFSLTTTLEVTEASYAASNDHASSEIPHLVWDSSEERIQTSTEVFSQFRATEIHLQTFAALEHRVGWIDLPHVSEPLEHFSFILISDRSYLHGVLESSTSFGFTSRLEPTPSSSFMLESSVFTTSEEVTSRIEASTSATDETVSSVQLYDSFLWSVHNTSFHRSRSSEAHQSVLATNFFEEFHEVSSSFLGTTEHREAEYTESISIEHAHSTYTAHTQSTSLEHGLSVSTEHAESSTEYVQSTSLEHDQSISTEYAASSTGHVISTSTEHAELTSIEHLQSTSIEQVESTAAEQADLPSTENVKSTSIEHLESTDLDDLESVSTQQAESTSTEHIESLSTQTETESVSSQLPAEDSSPIPAETSIVLEAVLSSSLTLNTTATRSDLVSAEISSLSLVSSIADVTYGDSSQTEEIVARESFTGVSFHECPSCSSTGHSFEGIASTTVYSVESSTFPSDLDVQSSSCDASSVSYSPSSGRLDTTLPPLIDTIFHTSFNLAGSESELPSTLFSLPVITQFLSSSWNIHVSSEDTAATISSIVASEEHTSSVHPFDNTLFYNGTSSFYSSLYLTQTGAFSGEDRSYTDEHVFSSRHGTLHLSGTQFPYVPDTLSKAESIYMSYTSDIATSPSLDRIRASEAINTSTVDCPHVSEEMDTSGYEALHTTEETDTSSYETLHVSGFAIASSGDLSSYQLIHDSATHSESLKQSMASQLQETSTGENPSVQTYLFLASLVPASSSSIGTGLLLTSTLTTSHMVAESVSVSSQRYSGRSDVDVASLSTNLTSTTTKENVESSSQDLVFTPSAIIYSSTERLPSATTFGTTIIPEQVSTGTPRELSTSTTPTAATTVPPTPSTTVEYTSPHIETSTDVVHRTISNFTIAIYFDGECEKISGKKYTGILNTKMLQFIHNVSQTDDKNSILVGHLKCNPNHIPVSFVQADRTLVFLHLNDTFSNSPKYLRIHSIVLKLTGYSDALDVQKKKVESEITPSDIAIFATASCICLVLIIAGLAIFAKEIYHKKFANRFSSFPGSLGMLRKTESVALRNIPTSKSDYTHVEMNEEVFVNEAYSSPCEDEYSSVASQRKTAFPSSEASSPEKTRDASKSKKSREKNAGNTSKSISTSSGSLNNGSSRHESPGYGLIIGLMGYTKRLERQQRKQHQQQQQKLQFEESSFYAVPQKRSKTKQNQDNTKANATTTPASFSPTSRPIRIEDSPVPPPRHLRTLHEVNETYESNEELVPFTRSTGTDNSANARTDAGLDNPSFLNERGHSGVDSNDVFHF